jgi:hypothetical protein
MNVMMALCMEISYNFLKLQMSLTQKWSLAAKTEPASIAMVSIAKPKTPNFLFW